MDLDHVYYTTADMDRAVAFYQDVVGLRLLQRYDGNWAEFDAGPVKLALHGTTEGAPAQTGGATAGFRVEDLDTARADLKGRGVEFVHEGEVEGYGRFALFADPDGNLIELIEYAREES